MLLTYRDSYKTLDDLNQDEMRLGGLRINPTTNISSTVTYMNNIKLRKINDKNEIQVSGLPANPRISNISWSTNEENCFSHTTNSGVELWLLMSLPQKRLNLPKTKSTLTLETLLAGIATTKTF
jgi:hypothetical protein